MLSHVQFSFEMFVLTERNINYAVYQTKEYAIREKLISLGNRALTSAKWVTESEALVDVTVQHHKFQLSSDNDQVIISRHGSVSLWEAILQQHIYSPSRETILNTLNNNPRIEQNQKIREIIMEALVVLGLHQIISESIQLRVNTSIGHQYVIADIQKMFEWVTITDLGLFVHAEKSLETILDTIL